MSNICHNMDEMVSREKKRKDKSKYTALDVNPSNIS